jgi:hypothetical protein
MLHPVPWLTVHSRPAIIMLIVITSGGTQDGKFLAALKHLNHRKKVQCAGPAAWANETTKGITVSRTMLRHAEPDTTAIYTHGNFGKALDAQRVYMEQLLRMKPLRSQPNDSIGLASG